MTDDLAFLDGGGQAAAMILQRDWSDHPLGPPRAWPEALRVSLSLVLNSPESMILAWGPDLHCFFNDTYFPLLGPRLAWAMGERFDKVWADAWAQAKPIIDEALAGRARRFVDLPWTLDTDRGAAQTWWTFSYSRVLDADGAVAGLFILTNETTARVRSDAALRESEESLRLVIEGARDHAILTTDPSGRITSWSAGAERAFGLRAQDAIGQPAAVTFVPEDRASAIDAIERATAVRDGRAPSERWRQRKDGSPVFMVGSMHPLPRDDQGAERGFIIVARDETEQRRLARRTEQEIARQRRSLQQMPGFAAVLSGPDHVYDYFNDAYVAIAGARDFLGRSVREVFPELEGQGFYELLDRVYATGEPFVTRAMPIRLAGEAEDRFIDFVYQPIRDDAGDVSGIFVGGYDITERVRAVEALAESEERLRLATEAAEMGFWDVDPINDVLIWPPRVKAMFGISAQAPISMADFYAGLHPDDRAATLAAYEGAVDPARRALYDVEYRTVGKEDGVIRWVAAKGRGVFDAAGACVRVVGTALDVTERKRDEARLRDLKENLERRVAEEVAERGRTEEALRQAQKMEAVGQLTGGLAHDFNNLLAGVSGALEMMQRRVDQDRVKDVTRYIGAAQDATRRAAALTHRLLAFSRRQTLDPKATDVNRLVSGMEDLIRRTIGPSIRLDLSTEADLWPALVDPSQLENALLNLCINARDAMPDGGRIQIETANERIDERLAREIGMAPGEYLSLRVADTGAGMSEQVIAKAFDPFFTTKPIGKGTGLGLSMIYGFARQSGGQVSIRSKVGAGATVCIYLPRHHGGAEEVALIPPSEDAHRAELGETVLVVDDEGSVRMLVAEVMADLGYAVIEAADSVAGLKLLQSDVRIDLLITDVGLPGGMNGRQLADAARIRRPEMNILFITGYAEAAVLSAGALDPGMAILTKPFPVDALATRIRDLTGAARRTPAAAPTA